MSDFEDIERELKSLSPKQPSNDFCRRVERALGEAGTVAMCHMPANKESSNKSLITYIPFSFGIAVVVILSFLTYFSIDGDKQIEEINQLGFQVQPSSVVDDDSPLHGVTSEQLEGLSGMPANGWMDPFTEERLLMRVDEGVIDRASGVPARQYRYHFVDETLWTHPASEIRILSTTPRQEVYLIDLESY